MRLFDAHWRLTFRSSLFACSCCAFIHSETTFLAFSYNSDHSLYVLYHKAFTPRASGTCGFSCPLPLPSLIYNLCQNRKYPSCPRAGSAKFEAKMRRREDCSIRHPAFSTGVLQAFQLAFKLHGSRNSKAYITTGHISFGEFHH